MLNIYYDKCDNCCTCISVCPEMALIYQSRLEVNHDICTQCGRCVKVCPFAALSITKDGN